MSDSILNGKWILAVDDEPSVLDILGEELVKECPAVKLDTACTFKEATAMLALSSYDLVILDVEGVRGLDLLKQAVDRGMPAIVFSANPLTPSPLKESFKLGARGFLPKEKLGEIVPFLEDVLESSDGLSGWVRLMNKLEGYFASRWGKSWKKSEKKFWKDFEKKTSRSKK